MSKRAKWQKFENPYEVMPDARYSAFRKRSSLIMWEKWGGVRNTFGPVFIREIRKGKEYDLVYGDIGFGGGKKFLRKFICKTTNSRKQIYTLTKNQYAIVYALCSKSSKAFYVRAWWAAYIPKIYDRMEIDENESDKFTGVVSDEDLTDKDIIDTLKAMEEREKKNEKQLLDKQQLKED